MSRQRIGSRKKSIQASQYRVGRYGRIAAAASSVTSTWLVTSTASAPIAAPSAESVTVDRNSAIAATPSIETTMYATVASSRSTRPAGLIVTPDSEVTSAGSATPADGSPPNMVSPVISDVVSTAKIANSTKAISATSLATSRRVRPTGRTSRYRSVPVAASPATASPASTATETGRNTGMTSAIAAAG